MLLTHCCQCLAPHSRSMLCLCRQKRAGSLSEVSNETQATGGKSRLARRAAIHWQTRVVLPNPAGAERSVRGPSRPASSSANRWERSRRKGCRRGGDRLEKRSGSVPIGEGCPASSAFETGGADWGKAVS